MVHSYFYRCIAIKGGASRQHRVQNGTQRVHVGCRTHPLTLRLLRRVVLYCTDRHACRVTVFVIYIDTGKADAGQFDRAVTPHHHIPWFERAMHDTLLVRRAQAQRRVVCNDDGTFCIEYVARAQIAAQIGSLDQFHHNEINTIGLTMIVDLYNIWVPQSHHSFCNPLESRHELWVYAIDVTQYFDSYFTMQNSIPAPVNPKHKPSSNWVLHLVPIVITQVLELHSMDTFHITSVHNKKPSGKVRESQPRREFWIRLFHVLCYDTQLYLVISGRFQHDLHWSFALPGMSQRNISCQVQCGKQFNQCADCRVNVICGEQARDGLAFPPNALSKFLVS